MKRFTIVLLLISISFLTKAQTLLNIIDSPLDTLPCNQNCKMVNLDYVKPLKTNQYTVASVPFSPVNINSIGTSVSLLDDKFSTAIPIGFSFCFYGQTYSQLYFSSNGHITFNSNYSGLNCSFDTKKAMPFYNATYPDNAIFCPFTDVNTMIGGTIKFATTGIAPFRKMIISYEAIPYFGTACTAPPATFQCVLSETMNYIDCFITSKQTCSSDTSNWLNFSTLGIQNTAASSFLTVPGRNASIWNASNEGWRFSPAGAKAYTVQWYNESNFLLYTDVDSVNACAPFPKTFIVKLTLDCPSLVVKDTIKIIQTLPFFDSIVTTPTTCQNTPNGTITAYGNSINLPITYSLNNSGVFTTNNVFTNIPYGVSVVIMKDALGCTKQVNVNMPTTSTLNAVIDSFKHPTCPFDNGWFKFSASGGVPPYTYTYLGLPVLPNLITGLGPGVHFIKVTDAMGCTDSSGVALIETNLPDASANLVKPTCGNASGIINIFPVGGTPPYTFLWSNNVTTQNNVGIPSGNYTVIITDTNGCQKIKYYTLQDTLSVVLGMNTAATTCGFNNGIATANVIDYMPPLTYTWSNGGPNVAIQSNLPVGPITVTVVDGNGCTKSVTSNIASSTGIDLQLLPANAYCDSANGLINTIVTNFTGTLSYLWSNGDTTTTTNNLAAGFYWLKVTDDLGCFVIDTVEVKNDGVPILNVVSYQPPICYGDSSGTVILDGNSGVAPYKFSLDSINFSATAVLNNFSAGTYTIYVRDANSCFSDTVITFESPEELNIQNTIPDSTICYYDQTSSFEVFILNGKPPYLWKFNNGLWEAKTKFENLKSGIYTIEVKDSNGCVAKKEIEVVGPPLPLAVNFEIKNVPCYEENIGTIKAQITGGWLPVTFQWVNNASNSLFVDKLSGGTYIIKITDNKGCELIDKGEVKQDYCCNCYLPNSFTPNRDDINDVFRAITPEQSISDFSLKIVNRWGQLVFASKDPKQGWDGNLKGIEAEIGTYFYYCEYKCKNVNEKFVLKGDITLLR